MDTTSNVGIKELNDKINKESAFIDMLMMEMNKVIVGQKHMTERLLIGLLSNGHILLEGVPGLAKTLAINTLATTIDANFSRIQFTPDLLPADVLGTQIYSPKNETFSVKKGPIFVRFSKGSKITNLRLTDQSVALIIKEYLTKAGLDNKNYSGHSLRSGFATSAAEAGAEERSIMAMTGHKSTEMVRRYIKEANLFKNNALNKIKM